MQILVIGGGGREHAIVHSLNKSDKVDKIYCAPSNAGINFEATGVNIAVSDFAGIVEFLEAHKQVELTVVAPDNPLVDGLVNYLEERGHRAFGPRAEAAFIEGSKVFSKSLMKDFNIPTATYEDFSSYDEAVAYIKTVDFPQVIKADGLAYGKGVIICETYEQAETALKQIMIDGAFGSNNNRVIIEEFLVGREVSVLAFTDGKTVVPMLSSQDHKRAYDGDKGLNTGGMGAFCPSPFYTADLQKQAYDTIILPTVKAMSSLGRTFKGVLYFGLMMTKKGIYTLEYNARFGDPETQAVLPLLKTDLLEIMQAIIDERLADINIEWSTDSAVTVVLASKGYPESYPKGLPITTNDPQGVTVYHAGTVDNGGLKTNGGRVIAVTAVAKDIASARDIVYKQIDKIHFDGMFYRKDIGII